MANGRRTTTAPHPHYRPPHTATRRDRSTHCVILTWPWVSTKGPPLSTSWSQQQQRHGASPCCTLTPTSTPSPESPPSRYNARTSRSRQLSARSRTTRRCSVHRALDRRRERHTNPDAYPLRVPHRLSATGALGH